MKKLLAIALTSLFALNDNRR